MAATGGPARQGRPALSRCVGVPTQEFAERIWGEQPLLSRSPGFDDLFGAAAVDELVSVRGLRTPFLRMARNGEVLAASRFTSGAGVGATIGDQADPARILTEMAAGATLVLQGLHRTWPPLREFADQLVHDLGHPVQINAYITPPSSRGFAAHYDTHDVFVLQIAGSKHWQVHEPVLRHPLARQQWQERKAAVAMRAAEPPFLDETLDIGDCLYLPRGWLHSATALGETSIHLTVGIHALTGLDVVTALAGRAADDPELRRSLPIGAGSSYEQARAAAEPLIKQGAAKIAASDPGDAADALLRRFAEATGTEPLSPLRQLRLAARENLDMPIRLRRGLRASVETGERATLRAGDLVVSAPAFCADALRHVATGDVFRADDLPGLDAEDASVLSRRLLREAIVVPLA